MAKKRVVTVTIMSAVLAFGVPVLAQTSGAVDGNDQEGQDALLAELATMEEVLVRTVNQSVRDVEQQLPSTMPGIVLFAGPAQVRGFRLADYGVFFDVEYPVLRRTILWSMQMLGANLEADFRMFQRRMERLADLPSIERMLGDDDLVRRSTLSSVGLGAAADQRARDLDLDAGLVSPVVPSSAAQPRVPGSEVDDLLRAALNGALVDAVLRHGDALAALLGQDEWLTVTARDVRARRSRDSTLRVKARDVVFLKRRAHSVRGATRRRLGLRDGDLTIDVVRARVDGSPF